MIATQPSLEGIANLQSPANPTSLYFGIGLVNSHGELSKALPIDVLSMILAAEKLGVQGKKYIWIADTHAGIYAPSDNSKLALFEKKKEALWYNYLVVLNKIIDNLGFSNWKVAVASLSIDPPMSFQIEEDSDRRKMYEWMEIKDINVFRDYHNVGLKLGWAYESAGNFDEIHFDRLYKEKHPESDVAFLYVKPGMTFNPKKLRTPPYFCEDEYAKIVFPGESHFGMEEIEGKISNAKERWGERGIFSYRNYLKNLVRLFDSVAEPTKKGPLEQRLQEIMDRCIK